MTTLKETVARALLLAACLAPACGKTVEGPTSDAARDATDDARPEGMDSRAPLRCGLGVLCPPCTYTA